MTKKNLLLLFMALMAFAMNAGAVTSSCYWGYCNNTVADEFGSQTSGKAAIYIPAEVAALYKGKTVTAVRIGLAAMSTNVTAFVTKDLNGTSITTKKGGTLYNGWNEVKFSTPYEIDGEGFYIGYIYSGSNKSLGRSNMYSENGCWADLGDGWKNYATDPAYNAYALNIQAKISGEDMPKDIAISSSRTLLVKKGEACQIPFSVTNLSSGLIRKFVLAYSIDGGEEIEKEYNVTFGSNLEKELTIDHPGFDELGEHKVNLRIISVDGEKDAYDGNNTAQVTVKVMSVLPLQRLVVEEGTGTWCGYCPEGIVGMAEMTKKYPDTFIGIAVHKKDEFTASSYNGLTFSAYPNCYVNRVRNSEMKPSFVVLESVYKKITAVSPKVGVGVSAQFTDESKTKIKATAYTTFYSDMKGMSYRISFVLTESGVMAQQANNYAGGKAEMGGFEKMDSWAYVSMDHIARMNYSFNGYENSVPTSVAADETTEFTQVLDVPSDVKNVDNTELIALLIDNGTGQIENAAKVEIGKKTTGIENVAAETVPGFALVDGKLSVSGFGGKVSLYDLNGMQVSTENVAPGLYIVKAVDGGKTTVKKVMLK